MRNHLIPDLLPRHFFQGMQILYGFALFLIFDMLS